MVNGPRYSHAGGRGVRLPLDGVKVLDFTQYLSGPYCTMLLADLGARVVKVESPSRGGDPVRSSGGGESAERGSIAFRSLNRNKQSVSLDLDREPPATIDRLATWADVVVENFRPGVTEKLGITYERFAEVNPRIIYGTIRGYRSTGPLAERGGFDVIAQGMSGLMSITGMADGPPCKVGVPITDVAAGTNLAVAILAALFSRSVDGRGQYVEASLMESGLAFGIWEAAQVWQSGTEPGRLGSAHRAYAPYQAIATQDGHITLGVMDDTRFRSLCDLIGAPEVAGDPRFASNSARVQHRDELIAAIETRTGDLASEELVDALNAAGIPSGRVLTFSEVLEHPQTREGSMVWELPDAGSFRDRGLSSPLMVGGRPTEVVRPAPNLGEHTRDFLEEIDAPRDEGSASAR